VLVAVFLTHSVRWPLSFFTSARKRPSPEIAIRSIVPTLVIWLTEIVANGRARGQIRHAPNPAAARMTRHAATIASRRDFLVASTAALEEDPGEGLRETCAVGPLPEPLFRCKRFKSARSSAADWQRSSRSFSNALLRTLSNSTGMYGPPPYCKRKMKVTELVCANVSGLCWSSYLLA
jgi:hypothetical protein